MSTLRASRSLPSSIRVAAYDIAMEKWSSHAAAAASRWGEFSAAELTIRVQAVMPSVAKLIDTVLHEIGHAIYWAYGLEDEDREERIVGTMATAWTQVWRDNPLLLLWLNEAVGQVTATR